MRVAVYQTTSPAGDIPAGLDTVKQALKLAAQSEVQLLVMPELFLPGYDATSDYMPDGWGTHLDEISSQCKASGVALAIGLPEFEGDAVYNSAYAFSDTGSIIAKYRKIQLFGPREQGLFSPGDQLVTFDYRDVRFGLLICYDVEFPEHVRALKRAGAEVVLVPTANMMPFVNVNQILVPARAAENALTILYANYCGSEGDLDYVGLSTICGPDGYALAGKGEGVGLLVAELPNDWREHDIPLSTQITDLAIAKDAS